MLLCLTPTTELFFLLAKLGGCGKEGAFPSFPVWGGLSPADTPGSPVQSVEATQDLHQNTSNNPTKCFVELWKAKKKKKKLSNYNKLCLTATWSSCWLWHLNQDDLDGLEAASGLDYSFLTSRFVLFFFLSALLSDKVHFIAVKDKQPACRHSAPPPCRRVQIQTFSISCFCS